jgi:hypothetical protein
VAFLLEVKLARIKNRIGHPKIHKRVSFRTSFATFFI